MTEEGMTTALTLKRFLGSNVRIVFTGQAHTVGERVHMHLEERE